MNDEQRANFNRGAMLDNQAQDEYELTQFINSLEARLAGFTSQELIDEYYRRLFYPYNTALQQMKDKLDKHITPF